MVCSCFRFLVIILIGPDIMKQFLGDFEIIVEKRKTNDGQKKYVMERNDIVAARLTFLRKMHMIRSSGDTRPTFYLDETLLHLPIKPTSGKGSRSTVLKLLPLSDSDGESSCDNIALACYWLSRNVRRFERDCSCALYKDGMEEGMISYKCTQKFRPDIRTSSLGKPRKNHRKDESCQFGRVANSFFGESIDILPNRL
ncbi:hypothetical protein ANN_15472 [Periplaneta americana]|uniref:Uncharacterized protein n=1 Tax=Periplaneta americana TaxID=6978 RepID=A0ABQ8SID4_PERAM|nr:hypothetical protein ANN_15472 [Periplaneta americana]